MEKCQNVGTKSAFTPKLYISTFKIKIMKNIVTKLIENL